MRALTGPRSDPVSSMLSETDILQTLMPARTRVSAVANAFSAASVIPESDSA